MLYLFPTLLLSISGVEAHGIIKRWVVNGEDKAGYNPTYPPEHGPTAERPTDNADWGFADFHAGIVACGGNSPGSGLQTWDLDAGSTVIAGWESWQESHKGPVMEWMAKCPGSTCDGVAADSLDWFKINQATWDGTEWPSDKIHRDHDWSFQIPSDLAPGAYLVRHEIIALHTPNEPQVYPVCFQANLKSSGTAVPSQTLKMPDAYTRDLTWTQQNIHYNFDPAAWTPPGGPVYNGGGGGVSPAPVFSSSPDASSSSSASSVSSASSTSTASISTSTEPPVNGGEATNAPAPAPAPASSSSSTIPAEGAAPEPTATPAPPSPSPSKGKGKCNRRRQLKAGKDGHRKRANKRSRLHPDI